jgi:release factor glutamine methyltransferase
MDVPTICARLAAAGCLLPDHEARELSSHAPEPETLERWVRRREHGEPLAWIVGSASFCGFRVRVDPGVYVPRPQTEQLAVRAARLLPRDGAATDLCTGSGAIAAHLMRAAPSARVVATDLDRKAVACARNNGVRVIRADLAGPLRSGVFDVVTGVAPYVPTAQIALLPVDVRRYEPRGALDGGGDGLDSVRRLIADAARLLRPGGWLLTEIGGAQDRATASSLTGGGFTDVASWHDQEGDLRGIAARRA